MVGPNKASLPAASPAGGSDWTMPMLGMDLVYVAPGSFRMGSDDGAADEQPVHDVRISRGFWMGRYQVTQAEFEAMAGSNPSRFPGARNPVENASWNDAMAFCARIMARERTVGRLPSGYEYRLPTEAEWEFAARGGNRSRGFIHAGSDVADDVAWYHENSGDTRLDDAAWDFDRLDANNCRTHPVGGKRANELGLHDMSGNVWEWCLDWYDESFYGRSPGTDPVNLQVSSSRVFRGGCWNSSAGIVRAANRVRFWPGGAYFTVGFRVCLAPIIQL